MIGPELIVRLSFHRIAMDFVGLVDLLELLLGDFISLGFVRMQFKGKLLVCLLDIDRRCRLCDAQHFIVKESCENGRDP